MRLLALALLGRKLDDGNSAGTIEMQAEDMS